MEAQQKYNAPNYFVIFWLIVLFVLFAWKAFSQERKDLPETNQQILHFIDSTVNTQVVHRGKATCRHFVIEALNYTGKYDLKDRFLKRCLQPPEEYFWWENGVTLEEALPGDLISIGTVHIMILYDKTETPCD